MKQFIRKLSCISDSLLRSNSTKPQRAESVHSDHVPEGHVPVYVGEEMQRFVLNAEILNHPVFMNLLNLSVQEYGYTHNGVLRIPCRVSVFEQVLEAVRLGRDPQIIRDILGSSSDETS
ncbi:auxin-responsive protein SAUR71-like [Vicia villosa]|uniref:auxin-responsive protein SAUR71-like n=1 Tax=Vicia villosa TaxID=3911 RepID=UPI00273B28B3|nr:auxin-responsive protein SAUR71-like [Vicia villosa]